MNFRITSFFISQFRSRRESKSKVSNDSRLIKPTMQTTEHCSTNKPWESFRCSTENLLSGVPRVELGENVLRDTFEKLLREDTQQLPADVQ